MKRKRILLVVPYISVGARPMTDCVAFSLLADGTLVKWAAKTLSVCYCFQGTSGALSWRERVKRPKVRGFIIWKQDCHNNAVFLIWDFSYWCYCEPSVSIYHWCRLEEGYSLIPLLLHVKSLSVRGTIWHNFSCISKVPTLFLSATGMRWRETTSNTTRSESWTAVVITSPLVLSLRHYRSWWNTTQVCSPSIITILMQVAVRQIVVYSSTDPPAPGAKDCCEMCDLGKHVCNSHRHRQFWALLSFCRLFAVQLVPAPCSCFIWYFSQLMQCCQRQMHYSAADPLLGCVIDYVLHRLCSPALLLQAESSLTRSQLSDRDKVSKKQNHVRLKPKETWIQKCLI